MPNTRYSYNAADLHWPRFWHGLGWLWISIIIFLCLIPGVSAPLAFQWGDKIEHILAYIPLMLWFCALFPQRRWRLALCLLAMGTALEGLQALVPGRSAELADIVADGLGILLGWVLPHRPLLLSWIALENSLLRQKK